MGTETGMDLLRFATAGSVDDSKYEQNRVTGSFILIDPANEVTVGAGMMRG